MLVWVSGAACGWVDGSVCVVLEAWLGVVALLCSAV